MILVLQSLPLKPPEVQATSLRTALAQLHDLRHGAATIALAAGVDRKVVQEMLGHASAALTDTYTSVLPVVARDAAEAAARLVPRQNTSGLTSGSQSRATSTNADEKGPSLEAFYQVRALLVGAPPGTRTPNPRIKSPLLCQLS